MKRQFTASAFIILEDKVLLLFHRKLKKWLPAGGHIDENELPHVAAIREVLEETGLNVEIISDENFKFVENGAISIPRPHLLLLEDIPPYKNEEAHQHIDFIFKAKPLSGELLINERESLHLKWFNQEEIDLLEAHEIFEETRKIATEMLAKNYSFK